MSHLDLCRTEYKQIPIDKPDRSKLAFSYGNRQYVSKRCLYGLSTIPSAFCRIIAEIFGDIKDVFLYLDDICIVSTTWKEHVIALEQLFSRAIEYGLNLSAKKSKFAVNEMQFLGFKIHKHGVTISDKHLDTIKNYPRPESKKQLKSFLGVVAFNSRLLKDAAVTLHPLHRLSSPKTVFNWTSKHEIAFNKIRDDLVNA